MLALTALGARRPPTPSIGTRTNTPYRHHGEVVADAGGAAAVEEAEVVAVVEVDAAAADVGEVEAVTAIETEIAIEIENVSGSETVSGTKIAAAAVIVVAAVQVQARSERIARRIALLPRRPTQKKRRNHLRILRIQTVMMIRLRSLQIDHRYNVSLDWIS